MEEVEATLLPVYRVLAALEVIHGKLDVSQLEDIPGAEIEFLKERLDMPMEPAELWELGDNFYAGRSLPRPIAPSNFDLFPLPSSYKEMIHTFYRRECQVCGRRPEHPAVCLICGTVICRASSCCTVNGIGESTQHAAVCGGTQGAFMDMATGEFYIISGQRAAPYDSAYVNMYRESRTKAVRESDLEWSLD